MMGVRVLQAFLCALAAALSLLGSARSVWAAESAQKEGAESMDRSHVAERNRQKFFGESPSPLMKTDPDLASMRDRLLYGEIVERGTLDDRQRMLVALVVLTANQTLDDIKPHTDAALRVGVSPD